MLEDHEDDEDADEDQVDADVPVAWRFDVSVIGGFLLPIVTSMLIFPHEHEPELCEKCKLEVAASKLVEEELSKELAEASTPSKESEQSVVVNASTLPSSYLKKKHNSIA
jgi:hypothetical protein